jgi:thioredoxin reductase (NADPH)
MAQSLSPVLSDDQLEILRSHGEERVAEAGETLFTIGDETYPLIAILEGEATIRDRAGEVFVRHGPSGFLGEMNLLSGQTVYITAVAETQLRYIAVEREALRELLFEEGPLTDLLLSTFIARREGLQTHAGIGVEVFGPRDSAPTRAATEFLRDSRVPFTWRNTSHGDGADVIEGIEPDQLPLVRLP